MAKKRKKKFIEIHSPALIKKFDAINKAKKARRAAAKAKKPKVSALVAKIQAKAAKKREELAKTKAKASSHSGVSKVGSGPAELRRLHKTSTNKLEYLLFQAWKGYRIARGQNDIKRLKYYAEGIDKFSQELEGRPDITEAQRRQLKKHALPFPKKPNALPRYADGLWLKEKSAPGGVQVISPLKIFTTKP